MFIKKGFTLAEILIVLIVIGVIAVLTIPGLVKNATETQYKTAYQKAYKSVSDITTLILAAGKMPVSSSDKVANQERMWWSLNENLNVKNYAEKIKINSGVITSTSSIKASISTTDPYTTAPSTAVNSGGTDGYNWINTEDGLSFAVVAGGSCSSKRDLTAIENDESTILASSCSVIVVDVNSVAKTPNVYISDATTINDGHLRGDQYYIYVGYDGITAGSQQKTATGRILAGVEIGGKVN